MAIQASETGSYTEFVEDEGATLRRALCVALGRDLGLEATSEALSYGWQHWDRVGQMDNPIGYLYRVGRSRVRKEFRWRNRRAPLFDPVDEVRLPWVEPRLPEIVSRLSEHQRIAVVLRNAFDWSYRDIADLLGTSIGTVQQHHARGMRRLRAGMGVSS